MRVWLLTLARNAGSRYLERDVRRARAGLALSEAPELADQVQALRTATLAHLRTSNHDRVAALRSSLSEENPLHPHAAHDGRLDYREMALITLGDIDADEGAVSREAARLRKRLQIVKDKLRRLVRDPWSPSPRPCHSRGTARSIAAMSSPLLDGYVALPADDRPLLALFAVVHSPLNRTAMAEWLRLAGAQRAQAGLQRRRAGAFNERWLGAGLYVQISEGHGPTYRVEHAAIAVLIHPAAKSGAESIGETRAHLRASARAPCLQRGPCAPESRADAGVVPSVCTRSASARWRCGRPTTASAGDLLRARASCAGRLVMSSGLVGPRHALFSVRTSSWP